MTRSTSAEGIISRTAGACHSRGDRAPGAAWRSQQEAKPGKSIQFHRWFFLAALLPLLLASPSRASAYADPGTGAFVYQAAYAAFLAGAFYLRKLLDRLRRKPTRVVLNAGDSCGPVRRPGGD